MNLFVESQTTFLHETPFKPSVETVYKPCQLSNEEIAKYAKLDNSEGETIVMDPQEMMTNTGDATYVSGPPQQENGGKSMVLWRGITSATKSREDAMGQSGCNVLFEIKIDKGHACDIEKISRYPYE